MAEHKRHRDVPKERFLESHPQPGTLGAVQAAKNLKKTVYIRTA